MRKGMVRGRAALIIMLMAVALSGLVLSGCKKRKPAEPKPTPPVDEPVPPKAQEKLKVGLVTVGPVSDWGWNYQHNQGRLALEKALGDKVETTLAENIPETADAERIMRRMAAEGHKLIFSTSYGYKDFCLKAAKKSPDAVFMQAQAPLSAPNAATFNGSIWEASYVAGVVAAMTAKDQTRFGFIGAMPIPPIHWTVNAFTLGARSVNPKVTVDVVYTNSWRDPAAETEAVRSLAASGVKLVYALVDSTIAVIQAAEKAGIYSVSHHADLAKFAPKKYVTGAMWQWGKLYQDIAQKMLDGTWKTGPVAGGFKEGYLAMATYGPDVPEEAKTRSKEVIAKISSGELNVFAGPIKDNKGKVQIPEGKNMTVPEIVSVTWVVEGVKTSQK